MSLRTKVALLATGMIMASMLAVGGLLIAYQRANHLEVAVANVPGRREQDHAVHGHVVGRVEVDDPPRHAPMLPVQPLSGEEPAAEPMTASASISTFQRGSTKPVTTTIVLAGRAWRKWRRSAAW